MKDEGRAPLDDILEMILSRESEASHEVLMRWSKRYPEHCEALAEFFATWAVQQESPESPTVDEARIGNLMVSHALDILHRQRTSREGEANAGTRLSAEIASKKFSEEEFSRQCGLDESIVAKLDRRLIRVSTIPFLCLERIACTLSRDVASIKAMLTGPPVPLGAHKARVRPELKVEDFIEAVRSSDLGEDQKQEWIRANEGEK